MGDTAAEQECFNGSKTVQGLIVSHPHSKHAYHADGDVVDVFDPVSGRITEDVPLPELGDLDPLPASQSIGMISGGIRAGESTHTRDLLRQAISAYADRPMLGMEEEEAFSSSSSLGAANWRWVTWKEVGLRAENLARALQERFSPHTFVGICASNSTDWVVAWMAVVLAELVVVPFHATATKDYATHVVQEAQLALVFVDARTLQLLQDNNLSVPLCVIDRCDVGSATESMESPVVEPTPTIDELLEQGAALRSVEAERQAMASGLLQRIRALVVIKVGANVEMLRKGIGWVSVLVTAGEDTADLLNVKIQQGGREVVARRYELRASAQSRAYVSKLLWDCPNEVLNLQVDALASIVVHLAGTEETAAARAAWVPLIRRLRPTKCPDTDTADLEDTLIGLAKLWAIEADADQRTVWETLALRSGRRAWADAVLTFICEQLKFNEPQDPVPVRAELLDRALTILQGLERIDPRTAALASDVAMQLHHTVQGGWFKAIAEVDYAEGLAEGRVYRLLRDADLAKEDDQSSAAASTVRVTAGAYVEVVQLEGKRAKVRSDLGSGWLNLFEAETGAKSRIRKGARVRLHGFGRACMNGLEGVVTQEQADSGAKVKVQLQDVSKHKAQVDPDGKKPLLVRMRSGTVVVVSEDKLQIVEEAPESLALGEPDSNDALSTLLVMYTSGSTGLPKGALMADHSFLTYVGHGRGVVAAPKVSDSSGVHIRAGPLSTSGNLHNLWTGLLAGGRVGLIRDSSRLFDVLESLAPTLLTCVPQMWAVLHKRFQLREAECKSAEEKQRLRQEARRWLGHRISMISTGGAMPHPDVMAWLKDVFPQASVHESYGCTEAGSITRSGPGAACEISKSCQVKLKDSPPFLTTDRPFARGAVWVKTNRMAHGYLNRPEETRSSFDADGFFDTGDIGEMISATQLRLIDRKENTFKLSNGEWVAPEQVEGALTAVQGVEQIFVHGSSSVSSVVAVVVSDSTPEQLRVAFEQARGSLRHFEVPAQVHVTQEPWTAENGLLTGSHKLSRHALRQKFAEELRSLLDEVRRGDEAAIDVDVARAIQLVREGEDEVGWREMATTLSANSILTQRVAFALKDTLGVDIPVVALLNEPELADLEEFIRGARPLESIKSVDWDSEATIDEELVFEGQPEREGDVLLTGSTGHVGAAVLEALLQEFTPSRRPVCCLVRAANDEAALKRIVDTLRNRGYDNAAKRAENGEGVRCVAGDLSMPLLGVDEAQFNALANSTSVVLNVGCWVHHIANFQKLKAPNVDSVATLLRLASIGPRTRFVQVSTTSARAGASGGGYAQSKWVAERMVAKAIERGLDGAVLQLGFVGPDRRTGAANVADRVMRFVAGTVQLGVHHFSEGASLLLFPVEVCAAAIVQLSFPESGDGVQATAELEPVEVVIKDLMKRVGKSPSLRGRRMHAVSRAIWQAELRQLSEQNPMFPLLSHYQDGLPGRHTGPHSDEYHSGYNQEEVDRFVAFLQASSQLGAACDLPILVRTSSVERRQSFHDLGRRVLSGT